MSNEVNRRKENSMKILDITKMTGILICYSERVEMDKVHARLKELKQKEPELKDVVISKAYNPIDGIPYPWTIALLVTDAQKLKWLDDYLTDSKVDLGKDQELYAGELRVQDYFRMLPLDGKYEPGMVKIKTGTCPLKAVNLMACMFCSMGHLLECHFPKNCEEAQCQHLSKYIETQ